MSITDDTLTYQRKQEQIAQEAALDGIYVIRAGRIDPDELAAAGIVRAYKQLKEAEKGFGGLKGPLEVRPIYHRLEDRVRAHPLICMLAEYVRWHLRHAWAELLFQDEHPRCNTDPVANATRSPQANPQRRPPPHPPARALPHDREPLRRAREPHPQHDPCQRQRGDLPAAKHPDRAASTRARADQRARPPAHVAKRQTAPSAPESPKTRAKTTVVSRNFGLVSAQIVTADGSLFAASDEENPDLFWAIRGGGGNFGIVTSFEYRLHPVGPDVFVCFVLYPAELARQGCRSPSGT